MAELDVPRIHQRVTYQGREFEVLGHRKGGAEVWIVGDDGAGLWVGVGDVEAIEGGGRDG